jgi:hypothetical protein
MSAEKTASRRPGRVVRAKALAFAIARAQISGSGNAHRAITEAKPASLPPIDTDAKPVDSSSGQS